MDNARVQAFELCPPVQLRTLCGVLTDIDDTLTADGRIEPVALVALQRLHDAGMPVIAITGRPAGWSRPFALAWPVAAIVAENGAVMLRSVDDRLRAYYVQKPSVRTANALRLRACVDAVLSAVPGAMRSVDSVGRETDIAIDHSEFAHLDAAQIDAVCAVMREHGLRATVSSIHINGWIGEHSKWTGARWAVETALHVPFNPQEWLYVGDSTNDETMFERMPLSVGVANIARFAPRMRHLPTYVTRSERGAGFAEVAAALLAAQE
ncbi:HAD-IIB family hydrolase [Paucibacter sp. R3-3]|uniref:HAD-IIB family hydrolase n=1 Tax=Roseateles agri TaxID=3098619 RepID=A0ABU5DB87_9BURK|nr:HAD-IIB family hydrolase [Paucibacter sp. R3-3]MDY0743537.1 HAD-IIB family hydrolase [Paucibacter sp. R3-3]